MTESVVTWEDTGPGVLVATMDRRPANALGPPIIDGLNALLDEAERRGTRVLVLTSAIPGFFAAGADIKHLGTVDARPSPPTATACGRPSSASPRPT